MPISLFKKKAFFSAEEAATIVAAIRSSEQLTSGEIRVYIETKCSFIDPLDRAMEVFQKLNMSKTKLRNGILLYVATQDRQACIYGDNGINALVNKDVWQNAIQLLLQHFSKDEYVQGFVNCVSYIGSLLHQHFPYDGEIDKNELPDNIVFGK